MDRVLEPEVMDDHTESIAYEQMNFDETDRAFAADMARLIGGSHTFGHALDIGCGPGKIVAYFAHIAPGWRVTAVDLAGSMLELARLRIEREALSMRVQIVAGDAKALPFPDRSFDAVMCNSVVHHLPDPSVLFDEIARVCRPGGAILVRDLVRPGSTEEAAQIVQRFASGDTPHQQKLFYDSLLAALSLEEVQELVDRSGLAHAPVEGGSPLSDGRVRMSSDRHFSFERRTI